MAPQSQFELFSEGRVRVAVAFSVDWVEAERTCRYMVQRVSGNVPPPGVSAIPVTVEMEYWYGNQVYPFPSLRFKLSLRGSDRISDVLLWRAKDALERAKAERASLVVIIEKTLKLLSPHIFEGAMQSYSAARIYTMLGAGVPEILEVAINTSETSVGWLQDESYWARVLLRTSEK